MKRNILAGLTLMVFAFTGAAFTANKTLQANHYLQKPGECKAIPQTQCQSVATPDECWRTDGATTIYRVNNTRISPSQCSQPLFEREN